MRDHCTVENQFFGCAKISPRGLVPPRTSEHKPVTAYINVAHLRELRLIMSSRRLAARRISVLLEPRTRSSLQHGYHVGNVKPRPSIQWRIKALEYIKPLATYATSTGQRLDVQRLRTDVDKRARIGFYTLSHQQGALSIKPDKADAIIAEFLAQTKNMDHASNVKQLVASVFCLM
jgi:hypothetical protein